MSERSQKGQSLGFMGWSRVLRPFVAAMAAAFVFVVPSVYAQSSSSAALSTEPVSVQLTQHRVETDAGKEKLVEFESVKPGDVIEYRAVYANKSKSTVKDLLATLPVPDGLDYIPRSAKGSQGLPAAQVVLRDGRTGAEPLMVVEDGKNVEVSADQYRSLRWRVGSLAGGKSVSVSARVRVSMAPIDAVAAPSSAAPSEPRR